jgi:neutral ceramidase
MSRALVPRAAAVVALLTLWLASSAQAAALQAGVGRSDITPPTGFATFGYVRDDAIARGQHTRLFARSVVLREGTNKLAIVTTDLGGTPGGLLAEVSLRVARLGFSERNIIISASHTHSGPAGFSTFQADNFVAPTSGDFTHFKTVGDKHLYGFLINRVALAIERADANRGPARLGWSTTSLGRVTDNRSLEAHLANYGYDLPYGTGRVSEDPHGYMGTIDPQVDVLRVDRVRRHRSIPIGGWLDFADHGTVNPYQFGVYNADHTGVASRAFEARVRKAGHVPRRQDVVGAYGNADAGDMTAALRARGPAYAETVGRREANAMFRAWRQAGRSMTRHPAFDLRWSRSCFCGRTVEGGAVDNRAIVGLPFITGSEENRGPLYDVTHQHYEGRRLPIGIGPQSRKIQVVPPPIADFPTAVPLMVVRLGSRLIATIPGEATVDMGKRIRAAVLSTGRSRGVKGVALAGYSNEFVHYFTTPQEYDQQHYEGGNTLYGRYSSNLIKDDLAALASDLAQGKPAPTPYPFDPRHNIVPDLRPYGSGAAHGTAITQPPGARRLQRAIFSWSGATLGLDRPLDRRFVTVQRRHRRRWHTVTNDLGLQILWRVDDSGHYSAQWQVPLSAATGRYRFVVTGNRYRLVSKPFTVRPALSLRLRVIGRRGRKVLVALEYPPIDVLADLTTHPGRVAGGRIIARKRRKSTVVRRRRSGVFLIPAGAHIAAGAARDRFGNRNGRALRTLA